MLVFNWQLCLVTEIKTEQHSSVVGDRITRLLSHTVRFFIFLYITVFYSYIRCRLLVKYKRKKISLIFSIYYLQFNSILLYLI